MTEKICKYSPEAYARAVKPFHALIAPSYHPASDPANRVTVEARTLEEAKHTLEAEYGSGMVLSPWLDDDWQLPR